MACCRLHTLPPLPSLSPPGLSRRPLRLRPLRLPEPIRCSRENPKPKEGSDDYHATIRLLNSMGRRAPKKSLGQNYMLNSEVNERMSEVAGVEEGDFVLEIGPGTGALTNVLLEAGATVLAVEKDPYMFELVKNRFGDHDRLVLLQEDIRSCDIHSHMSAILEKGRSMGSDLRLAKVVANIPFNISTDVIKLILPMGDIFSNVILLLQDEVALRWINNYLRTPDYRQINIFVHFYSEPEYKFKVERTNFFPQPKINAAVAAFKLKRTNDYPPVASCKSFFSMVNSAFNGKRKMLRKSLMHLCSSSEIENALNIVGVPSTSRPEELTLDDFVRLHDLIVKP